MGNVVELPRPPVRRRPLPPSGSLRAQLERERAYSADLERQLERTWTALADGLAYLHARARLAPPDEAAALKATAALIAAGAGLHQVEPPPGA